MSTKPTGYIERQVAHSINSDTKVNEGTTEIQQKTSAAANVAVRCLNSLRQIDFKHCAKLVIFTLLKVLAQLTIFALLGATVLLAFMLIFKAIAVAAGVALLVGCFLAAALGGALLAQGLEDLRKKWSLSEAHTPMIYEMAQNSGPRRVE